VLTFLTIVELAILIKICLDDHAMRKMAEESLVISRESLAAQKEYLDLRRRWYASREKKKTDEKVDPKQP
jgi:hypothetical protein